MRRTFDGNMPLATGIPPANAAGSMSILPMDREAEGRRGSRSASDDTTHILLFPRHSRER